MARTAGRRDVGRRQDASPRTIDSQVRLSSRPGRPAVVELEERNGRLFYHRAGRRGWPAASLGDTLIADDRLAYGTRVSSVGRSNRHRWRLRWHDGGPEAGGRVGGLRGLVGEYGPDFNSCTRGRGRPAALLVQWFFDYPLAKSLRTPIGCRTAVCTRTSGDILPRTERAGKDGVAGRRVARATLDCPRRRVHLQDHAAQACRRAGARGAGGDPPTETGEFLRPDLIEVTKLDPTIKLDIALRHHEQLRRTAFYKEGRSFASAPPHKRWCGRTGRLKQAGVRPAHSRLVPAVVRDQDVLGRHARGQACVRGEPGQRLAAQSRLLPSTSHSMTWRTGKPIEMVSGYDEFSDRAYPDYPGGTSLQRWHRKLLRRAMEAEGLRCSARSGGISIIRTGGNIRS